MKLTLSKSQPSTTRCRLCGGNCSSYGRLVSEHEDLELVIDCCDECASLIYAGEDPVSGYSAQALGENYWLHYCQAGAGLPAMLEPLHSIDKSGELLDVGCGFGFAVDYWAHSGAGQACGMETADYGRIGSQKLGIEVHHQLLGDCPAVDQREFDLVYGCEVLEHLADPLAFCRALLARCKPDGVVVLTTPSSKALSGDHSLSEKIAALSPQQHYFVASEEGLRGLLEKAGFRHIRIHDSGLRLYVWASQQSLPSIIPHRLNWEACFSYLWALSANPCHHVASGALYRILTYAWSLRDHEQAARAFDALDAMSSEHYGIRLRQPDVEALLQGFETSDWVQTPAWLGVALLLGSQILAKREVSGLQPLNMAYAAEKLIRSEMENKSRHVYALEAEAHYPKLKPWIQRLHVDLAMLAAQGSCQLPRQMKPLRRLRGYFRNSLAKGLLKALSCCIKKHR